MNPDKLVLYTLVAVMIIVARFFQILGARSTALFVAIVGFNIIMFDLIFLNNRSTLIVLTSIMNNGLQSVSPQQWAEVGPVIVWSVVALGINLGSLFLWWSGQNRKQ